MIKPTATFRRCQRCDALLPECSPPSREAYQRGRITLGACSTILLDRKARSGRHVSHAAGLEGTYCDVDCLIAFLTAATAGKWSRCGHSFRRRVKIVSTGANPVTVTLSEQPLGPASCLVCDCNMLQRHYSSACCRTCGHGVEFHVRRAER